MDKEMAGRERQHEEGDGGTGDLAGRHVRQDEGDAATTVREREICVGVGAVSMS